MSSFVIALPNFHLGSGLDLAFLRLTRLEDTTVMACYKLKATIPTNIGEKGIYGHRTAKITVTRFIGVQERIEEWRCASQVTLRKGELC
jgi:hypothetical protein